MTHQVFKNENDQVKLIPKINIGTDIVEVKRFQDNPIEKNISFYKSIFSDSELEHCKKFSNPYSHLAGIFAAKEATIKWLDKPISMTDIHTFWDKKGKPSITVFPERIDVNVSISHTQTLAIAVSMIVI